MSYFTEIAIKDEDGNVIERTNLLDLPTIDLLMQIVKELKIANMHLAILTDNEITKEDLE